MAYQFYMSDIGTIYVVYSLMIEFVPMELARRTRGQAAAADPLCSLSKNRERTPNLPFFFASSSSEKIEAT